MRRRPDRGLRTCGRAVVRQAAVIEVARGSMLAGAPIVMVMTLVTGLGVAVLASAVASLN